MDQTLARARVFLLTNARLLERALFEVRFAGQPSAAVVRAVRAYRNEDGGLGHALEPDLRCAESQPLFAEVGLDALWQAGCRDQELALSLCGYLETVGDGEGLVPPLLDSARSSPHAPHWSGPAAPGLNPTAGICGLLHYQCVSHPWLSRATDACCTRALRAAPSEAHVLLGIARLADHLPDRAVARQLAEAVTAALPGASFFIPQAPVRAYGLTPLHFAPAADSPWREAFSAEQLGGHLDDLLGRQQADGGWPISWEAPGPAAVCEWRGRGTLEAVVALAGHGRIRTDG